MIVPTVIGALAHHMVHGYPPLALSLGAGSRVIFHPEQRDHNPALRHALRTLPTYWPSRYGPHRNVMWTRSAA